MTEPLLAFTYSLDNPPRVDQTLHVFPDGQVWYWAALPGAERPAGTAGTFRFDLDDTTLETCRVLADRLATTPDLGLSPVWGVIEMSVTARVGEREQTHAYGFATTDELPQAVRDAGDLAPALMSRAETAPLSVVSLTVDVVPSPPDGSRFALRFVLTGGGDRPVTFTVRPDSLRVERLVDGGWRELWAYGGQPVLGIVGPHGNLVDGVIVPVTLGPAESATLTFANATDTGGEQVLRAIAEGRVALVRPDGSAADPPDRSMRLISA
ncbi:MAG TPA: hypothetical protein VKB69_09195 [Micromonosporaceae bacterium]|nr:hypothetical protein [Micromonosporaceae bacterium]